VLQASYGYRDWAFTLTQNYYSGYETARRQIDGERNFIGGQSIFDLNIAYTGIKNLRLAIGVKEPVRQGSADLRAVANQFQAGYDVSLVRSARAVRLRQHQLQVLVTESRQRAGRQPRTLSDRAFEGASRPLFLFCVRGGDRRQATVCL
jgi:hypothetical protein